MMKDFALKKYSYLLIFFIALSAIASGCGEKKSGARASAAKKIMIAGSTSVQPIAEKLAEHYMTSHPEVKIEIQGGGSSAGIQATRSGAADIGASSRELKSDEKDLYETVICRDAIVLIVNPSNPVSDLSGEDIRKIFSGEISRWQSATAAVPAAGITAITREEGSGTRGAFEELIMKKSEINARCLVQDSTGALREIVASDPAAIGYVSFGGLNDKVKALCVDSISPTMESMTQKDTKKRYGIIRPFLFLTRSAPTGTALEFIKFIRSAEGAKTLIKEGLVPEIE